MRPVAAAARSDGDGGRWALVDGHTPVTTGQQWPAVPERPSLWWPPTAAGRPAANAAIATNPETWGWVVNLRTGTRSQSLLVAPSESFAWQLFGRNERRVHPHPGG